MFRFLPFCLRADTLVSLLINRLSVVRDFIFNVFITLLLHKKVCQLSEKTLSRFVQMNEYIPVPSGTLLHGKFSIKSFHTRAPKATASTAEDAVPNNELHDSIISHLLSSYHQRGQSRAGVCVVTGSLPCSAYNSRFTGTSNEQVSVQLHTLYVR